MQTKYFLSVTEQIDFLQILAEKLQKCSDLQAKYAFLMQQEVVRNFFEKDLQLVDLLQKYSLQEKYTITAVVALDQAPLIFHNWQEEENFAEKFQCFLKVLHDLERFYAEIGGIIGYHLITLKLIAKKPLKETSEVTRFEEPKGIDLSKDDVEVRRAVFQGLENMRYTAEIYPLGGAGDRLNLRDEANGEALPAAQLLFCGRTLLEGLIRDLQGREYLCYKLYGEQSQTPLAIMTSHEKNNHERLLEVCESNSWFGRSRDSLIFFLQPLIPTITEEGNWAMRTCLEPILKPGGHGVIWKAAQEQNVFKQLAAAKCRKALVRQINNPVAGVDNGLLALAGIGWKKNKDFGFASCQRLLNAPEGMDVLCETKTEQGYSYCITNIEYTEFQRHNIQDHPKEAGGKFSSFPSNTNILFVDLKAIEVALVENSLPGMILNMKNLVECLDYNGQMVQKKAGRLETTMQNIADSLVDHFVAPLKQEEQERLRTYLTYNERRKTISVVKQAYEEGKTLIGTPEGGFFEMMQNYRELLEKYCQMSLPPQEDEQTYLLAGPSFVTLFHPAMGVLYPVIGQKIRGGRLAYGAELILEIAEADIEGLDLEGSLVIEADSIMGKTNAEGVLRYDAKASGKCTLKNVQVRNLGIEFTNLQDVWKRTVSRNESLRITLHGNAEFVAEDVQLSGDAHFEVPAGHRLVIYQQADEVAWHYEKIASATWEWEFTVDDQERIQLEKVHLS